MVLDRGADGVYAYAPRTLEVESLSPLRTSRFELIGGATVQRRGASEGLHGGAPLEVAYSGSSPFVPLDHHSMIAFTALYRYETAYQFFERLGLGSEVEAPARINVLVFPRVWDGDLPLSTYTDNAAFSTDVGFIVARETQLSGDIPLAMNASVATHEFGHAMFHHLIVTARGLETRPAGYSAYYMSALNEGLADTFSIAAVGQPALLADSVPGEPAVAQERDVRRDWQLTQELHAAAEERTTSFYRIGTLVARTFWLLAEATESVHGDREAALRHGAKLAFDALRTFDVGAAEHTVDFFDHLLGELPTDHPDRAPLCEALGRTFGLVLDRVEACR